MFARPQYSFRKVMRHDLGMLAAWRSRPHVSEWWDSDETCDATDLADGRVARWIVSCAEHAFAYMQDYTVHGWEDHHFAHLPEGARGIDQFIADPDMVGVGHGSAFLRQRMQVLFASGAPVIATDPHPDNGRAIAAYRKAGFEPSGPPHVTQWGLILPMLAWP